MAKKVEIPESGIEIDVWVWNLIKFPDLFMRL